MIVPITCIQPASLTGLLGSGYCYGMRITPFDNDNLDTRSIKSGASLREYDVWRRWEDCLWFQEILEGEYTLMSRQKRSRLAAGKGVKKNGVYIHSDQAASFESLPPGPDANTIAKDIHELIPRLTKKGTLFRASQSTIEQRGREFEALIHALWQDEVPMLIRELRETRLVRDFFGFWRRDLDHERKRQSQSSKGSNSSRNSVSSTAFSMYFSASNISLALPTHTPTFPRVQPSLPQYLSSPNRIPTGDTLLSPSNATNRADVRRVPAAESPRPSPMPLPTRLRPRSAWASRSHPCLWTPRRI